MPSKNTLLFKKKYVHIYNNVLINITFQLDVIIKNIPSTDQQLTRII